MQLIQRRNKLLLFLVTLSLGKFFEFSVYFPSKLKIQVFVLLFLVTLFISPSILSLWELHALSFYKPLLVQAIVLQFQLAS